MIHERITADERSFFDVSQLVVTSTRAAWYVVKLNSLTKSTNSGFLYLTDGTRVFYKFLGEDTTSLHSLFAKEGLVRVFGVAHLDETLKVTTVEVAQVERVQGDLFETVTPDEEDGYE